MSTILRRTGRLLVSSSRRLLAFGSNAGWLTAGEPPARMRQAICSSGHLRLDLALGARGLPQDGIVELAGEPGAGKTTLALQAITAAQADGGICAFVDAERGLTRAYVRRLGVDPAALLIVQPDDAQQALQICERLLTTAGMRLVVVDTVAALAPEGRVGLDSAPMIDRSSRHGGVLAVALKRLAAAARRGPCTLLLVNQLRQCAGSSAAPTAAVRTAGGDIVRFHASARLLLRPVHRQRFVDGGEPPPLAVGATVLKHGALPSTVGRTTRLALHCTRGFCDADDLLALGMAIGVLQRTGSQARWCATELGASRAAVVAHLADHPILRARLRAAIVAAHLKPGPGDFAGTLPYHDGFVDTHSGCCYLSADSRVYVGLSVADSRG